jgi:hypothetical protein
MIGLESRFINSPTGITLAPTASTGGRPIIPYTPSPDASINYTNTPQIPETSWWDKLKGSIGSRGGGGGMKPAGFLPNILPEIPAQAPNPGFYLNLPREQKNRYSGGF